MSYDTAMALATGKPVDPPATSEVTTPEQKTAEVKELDSTRFNQLAKKEAELQRLREEYKKDRDAFVSERDSFKPKMDLIKQFYDTKEKDRLAALKMLDFNDTDIMNLVSSLEDTSTPEEKAERAARRVIEDYEKKAEERSKAENEERNKKIISEFKEKIGQVFSSDKEVYELSNLPGYEEESRSLAYDFTEECIKDGQDAPTPQECAEYVEKYWEEYWKEKTELMTKAKKLTPREAVEQAKDKVEQLKAEVNPMPKTLTNRATASTPNPASRTTETREQKRTRLEAQLRAMKAR